MPNDLKQLVLKSCSHGNLEYFIYPRDKYPDINFVNLLKEMEDENLIYIKGVPAVGCCYIQITDYGLDFLE